MNKLQINKAVLGEIGTNCYLLGNKENDEIVIIDPADDAKSIHRWLVGNQKKAAAILLTHGHYDHMTGAKELSELSGAKIYAAEAEAELLADPNKNLSAMWTMHPVRLTADVSVKDGDILSLAGFEIRVIATPGHTRGGLSFYIEEESVLFSGDTLFAGSYGRVDFPTSSMGELYRSIREKLLVLPPETVVYPGHGEATDIQTEREINPLSGGLSFT